MRYFNYYFALAAALTLLCGCQTDKSKSSVGILRIHMETPADNFGITQTVSVMRDDPVKVSIAKEPVFSEANLLAARLMETPGGYAIELKFDEQSALMLEQYSASNVGRHFVIFAQWSDKAADGRWIAAPLISHHIADGVLAFTPDMSREEAEQLATNLNKVAKDNHAEGFKSLFK
ncbi:MAG TPA: hypothetical protein VFV23_13465 [Verrucomicrobiae bacterium]|nr:hypothetical protein [Verrucomicrobiae bacterium]